MFADRLRKLRMNKGVVQKDVAAFLGISGSAYGFYEQGEREPDIDTIKKLAGYFNVSTDYLLDHRNDGPGGTVYPEVDETMNGLPPEALREIEEFKEYVRHKYGNKK